MGSDVFGIIWVTMQKGKIYQKDSSWWFRWKTPVILNGRKVWKDRYERLAPADQFKSAAAVEKAGLLTPYRTEMDTARMTPSGMQLVNDFIEHVFFPRKKESLRPSTLNGYSHIWQHHLNARLEGLRMCDLRLQVAQGILDRIARETPSLSSSINLRHIKWFAVSVFNLAAQLDAFNPNLKNPFADVEIPKTQRAGAVTRHATLDDVVAMINVLGEPAATVVALAAFSGLRKSEIQGLRWEDLKGNEIHVRRSAWRTTDVREQTKTDASAALVPIIPQLAKYLEAHRRRFLGEEFVFAGAKMGHPLDLHNLANRVIRPALKKANIPWCGWHGFRRGLATTLYELGADAKTRQAILRHADVNVTERHYTKSVDAVSRAAMNKVQKAFASKMKQARR
jgi:integrase